MAGHQVTGLAMSKDQARKEMEATRPDFVFLDIHLVDGPRHRRQSRSGSGWEPVCVRLRQRHENPG